MNKSTHFFGQSVFGQLISMIDTRIISRNSKKYKADHHVKRFTAKDHLISMLFRVFAKCSSLREVAGAMLGAMRSGAQFISYYLSAGFSLMTMVVLAGTMQFSEIVEGQRYCWNLFNGHIPATIAFFYTCFRGMQKQIEALLICLKPSRS